MCIIACYIDVFLHVDNNCLYLFKYRFCFFLIKSVFYGKVDDVIFCRPTNARRSSNDNVRGLMQFCCKYLSRIISPQPSGRQSSSTPKPPSKGRGLAMKTPLRKGNSKGEMEKPEFCHSAEYSKAHKLSFVNAKRPTK